MDRKPAPKIAHKELMKAMASASSSGAVVRPSGIPRDGEHGGRISNSTARALVLRNGRTGAMGTGELVAMTRLSGREKLELLAGEQLWECALGHFSDRL